MKELGKSKIRHEQQVFINLSEYWPQDGEQGLSYEIEKQVGAIKKQRSLTQFSLNKTSVPVGENILIDCQELDDQGTIEGANRGNLIPRKYKVKLFRHVELQIAGN